MIIGNTNTAGSTDTWTYLNAVPYTPTVPGKLVTVSLWCPGATASQHLYLGVYADNSGQPGVRLGVTNMGSQVAGGNWTTLGLAVPVTVAAGTKYWLAVGVTGGDAAGVVYQTVANVGYTDSSQSGTNLPATLVGDTFAQMSENIAIYATYLDPVYSANMILTSP